jgi:serine protease Do
MANAKESRKVRSRSRNPGTDHELPGAGFMVGRGVASRRRRPYGGAMSTDWRWWVLGAAMTLGPGVGSAGAKGPDVVELRNGNAVRGSVLAERRDALVVDLGFTVLVIPRREVAAWYRGAAEGERIRSGAGPWAEPEAADLPEGAVGEDGFYRVGSARLPVRNVRELAAEVGEAVVQVRTPSGLGSGFILNEEGYLLTNFHVIEGETDLAVEVYHQRGGQLERRTYRRVRIVALNKFFDLALLKIEDEGAPRFRAVQLGSSRLLAVGEPVFAVGSPLGLERTVTEGIVSTKTRELQGVLYLQTTAQINPGNSGGPLFDLRGLVVGVTNMKVTFGEGLGFAIPVERVREFLDHRDAYAYDNSNPNNPYRYLPPPRRAERSPEAP